MEEFTVKELGRRLACAIDWPRQSAGIRFLFDKEEFEEACAVELKKPIHFCRMVRAATLGNAVKADASSHKCIAAARALGLAEADEFHRSGQRGLAFQLYHDLGSAKYTRDRQTLCDHKAYGVMVKPLEAYEKEENPPHMIQIITNPYYAMRIIQGYTYYYGIETGFKMSGLQAVCSESTAYPYMSNHINLSMLCGGTRRFCKWGEDEVCVSIPYTKFPLTVEGTLRTMNLQDDNDKKCTARKKLKENHMEEEFPLEDNVHYCDLPITYQ